MSIKLKYLLFAHAAFNFSSADSPCKARSTSGISWMESTVENPLRKSGMTQMKKLRIQKLAVLSLLGSRYAMCRACVL